MVGPAAGLVPVENDPSLASAANFCCDAQLCPLVGLVLDGQFCMRRRKFIAFLGSAQQSEGVRRIGFLRLMGLKHESGPNPSLWRT